MTLSRLVRLYGCAAVLLAPGLHAQAVSPVDDLLRQAQNAFNDLKYGRADSLSRQVLNIPRTSTAQRTRALLLVAASEFPEEVGAQKRTQAMETLHLVVHSNIDVKFPQELTWPGLDSLLAEAKRTTFGMAFSADTQQVVVGPTGTAAVRVRANRRASFKLVVSQGTGTPLATDAADSVTSTTMHFATMRGDKPIFSTGTYEVTVVATDLQSGDTASAQSVARITAPDLKFETVPVKIDSSRYAQEHTSQYGWKGVVIGALVSGTIYGLSTAMHADTSLSRKYGADSKGMGIALAAGGSVMAASFLDPGRPIPSAIASNARYRDDFAKSIRDAQATNANRVATYTTTIVIQSGAR